MTNVDVARLRELEAAATPGPWQYWGQGWIAPAFDHRCDPAGVPTNLMPGTDADAELIVAAVNELVPLLDRLEAAEAMPPDAVLRNFAEAVGAVTPCLCSAQRARADAAEAERDALAAKFARADALHQRSEGSMSALYPDPLCTCGKDWPCPTVKALAGDPR